MRWSSCYSRLFINRFSLQSAVAILAYSDNTSNNIKTPSLNIHRIFHVPCALIIRLPSPWLGVYRCFYRNFHILNIRRHWHAPTQDSPTQELWYRASDHDSRASHSQTTKCQRWSSWETSVIIFGFQAFGEPWQGRTYGARTSVWQSF
jgi:hypothetical protein